jgi:hypothetical protein
MGNAFMPSVFSSMNQASRGTLQDIVQQRLMQDEMAQQQAALMQKAMMDRNSLDLRWRADKRATDKLSFDKSQAEIAARDKAKLAAEKVRGDRNKAAAHDMTFEAMTRGEGRSPGLLRTASEGGVPVSMLPPEPPKPKPTREEQDAEILGDALGRAAAEKEVEKRYPKPTKGVKVAKDNPKLPAQFNSTIQNRKGSTGFKTAAEAIKSVKERWQSWRANYPSLDLNAVETAIRNIYGEEPAAKMTRTAAEVPAGDMSGVLANARERALKRMKSRK